MNKFITGCLDKPDDKKDPRDFKLTSVMPSAVEIPDKFMCENLSSVFHQIYPLCTSAASVKGTKEQQERVELSAGFNYRNTKKLSGLYHIGGDYIKFALKAICKFGVCEENWFPKPSRNVKWRDYVRTVPSTGAYKNAEKYKGKTYWSIDRGTRKFKEALAVYKTPIVFAMAWYSSYNKCTGVLPLPDKLVAYHALAAVGYNEKYLIVKNSFGESWGHKGYFYIPFKDWNKHEIYNPWILLDLPNNNNKMKLIGNNKTKNQFVVGEDGVKHKLSNLAMLEDLHNAGLVNKDLVEWKDEIDGIIGNEWGSLCSDR